MGIIKTPAAETTEFTMSNEDFPALPGTQNNDSNTSGGSGTEINKVSNSSNSSSNVSNSNLNHSKRGLQISADGKVHFLFILLSRVLYTMKPFVSSSYIDYYR